jgi:hypothetical protein
MSRKFSKKDIPASKCRDIFKGDIANCNDEWFIILILE